jgi:gamma-glutamylcyclotransferase (GGCT)/AIG2-like uncharacterized protein YtfP
MEGSESSGRGSEVKVFVYGTLRTGQSNHQVIARWLKSAQLACIKGELYHLPFGYPAVTRGEGTVYGELMEFNDPSRALKAMDELEDYFGEGQDNLYDRVITTAWLPDGSATECFVYVFPESRKVWLKSEAVKVDGGDWVRYMANR